MVHGLYSVFLGDTSVPNMAGGLSPSTLTSGNIRLRVWFNNGIHGFQQLVPDPPLGSVPYALVAARLADSPVFMGNVGIGIESPSVTLDVAGRIHAASVSLGGFSALEMPGSANVFVGNAGNASTPSFNATGLGWGSLANVTVGSSNTAVGAYALSSTTLGGQNTAVGHDALRDNTTGNGNIALGRNAGRNLTTGNHNVAIGHKGVAGDFGTIRIGTPGAHSTTHLAGTVKAERFEGDGSGLTHVSGTLDTTGTVAGWGQNGDGQLTIPAGLIGISAIAAGYVHTVALTQGGSVLAWGGNDFGQATVPAGLSGVTAIEAGYYHTVALKQDGTVVAWGFNAFNQTSVPADLSGVTVIAAGAYHTVALKQNGSVVAWGRNTDRQTTVPVGLSGVAAIAAGYAHTVALKQDGTVVAWGLNDTGQTTVPAGLTGVAAIAAGGGHTVALKQDGTVVAWGLNDKGQATVPAGLNHVTAIAAGPIHTVALKQEGTVVAWGSNFFGQTSVPGWLSGVSAIADGGVHMVAIRQQRWIPTGLLVSGTVSAQTLFTTSDLEAKQQLTPVDPQSILTKIAQLPVSEWSFKSAPTIRHRGPMAQDMHAAFGLGPDNRHIATVDADGVTLAAIQALYARVLALERELEASTHPVTPPPDDSP